MSNQLNIEAMENVVRKNTNMGNHAIFYQNSKGIPEYITSSTCTGSFSASSSATQSPVLGIAYTYEFNSDKKDLDGIRDFADWVSGPDSVYRPLFDFLGKNYKVVRDENGNVSGAVISGDVAFQPMVNFFKSARTMTEHRYRIPFWKKWKMDRKKDPRLVYLLMYAYSLQGERIHSSHSPIEDQVKTCISLRKFLNNGKDLWGLDKDMRIRDKNRTLTGENRLMWSGGTFNVNEIPSAEYVEIPSHFYSLYNKKVPGKLQDRDFEAFFERVLSGEQVTD